MDYLEANYFQIGSNMKIIEASREEGFRGILILPEDMDNFVNEKLGIQHFISDHFSIHMFCLNFEGKFSFFVDNKFNH